MRNYEVGLLVRTDIGEEGLTALLEKVKTWIAESSGTVVKTDVWGRRRLAYTVKKQNEGLYVFISMQMPPAGEAALERNLRLSEPVMRYLVTRQESVEAAPAAAAPA